MVAATGDPLFSLDYSRKVFERFEAPRKEMLAFNLRHHLIFNECVDAVTEPLVRKLWQYAEAAACGTIATGTRSDYVQPGA